MTPAMDGTFDTDLGQLRFASGLSIGRRTDLDELRSDPEGSRFQWLGDDPRAVVKAAFRATLDGVGFHVSLRFEGGHLTSITLLRAVDIPDGAWNDIDADRAFHDAWLQERLGPGTPFRPESYPYGGMEHRRRWGSVGSYVAAQDAIPKIVIELR